MIYAAQLSGGPPMSKAMVLSRPPDYLFVSAPNEEVAHKIVSERIQDDRYKITIVNAELLLSEHFKCVAYATPSI
jgi:hypothetical protein